MSTLAATATAPEKKDVLYNFWRGHPNNHLLPVTEMQKILERMASPSNQERLQTSLQYLKSDRGDPVLLQQISTFLNKHTLQDELPQQAILNDEVLDNDKLDMFLTHGVSHGLDMLCTTQTTRGDVVLIERPCYFLAAGIFQSHGLQIESLPMKRESSGALMVDVDALERGLENGTIDVPRMIYIVPTHQNPTASTMPTADRWKLCQLARKYGFLVAADEVYHLLDWRENKKERPARFSVLDHLLLEQLQQDQQEPDPSTNMTNTSKQIGCSVSVSSFTKIFTPGVRCGWIEGPTEIIDSIVDLGYIQSQGGCAPFVGNVLRTALEEGFQDEILENLNASYKERSRILCDTLESEPGIQIHCRPTGGYFLWVDFLDLPETETQSSATESPASVFARFCFERGLKFMPGIKCDSVFDNFEQSKQSKGLCEKSARLCFADMDAGDVENGAKMLIKLYREYTGKQ